MCWTLIILVSADVEAKPNYLTVSVSACRIDIQWNPTNYTRFICGIKNENDENFSFNLDTNVHSFIYTGKAGQTYKINWVPIEIQMHVLSLQEEKKATIPKDCDRPPVTTSKNVKNYQFDAVHSTISLPDSKRENNGPFSNGFCEIYFWASLLAIPLVVCVITTILYFFVMRKPRGPIPNRNVSPQARLNAKSTCYTNDNGTNEYDEVQYSLAQAI
ncbi:uncharacterized protein LOC125680043 isoform X2 [Ostrea edulis]|uniref:uncharacterized protein LOC125680043 isoform X2 n=1 Tax=Ostrea edulis TaxID=37623 RepID=UPI0024AFB7DA|nr:uncharacterized protein LOC125680043 isoform X2 [Ostrea edulis]